MTSKSSLSKVKASPCNFDIIERLWNVEMPELIAGVKRKEGKTESFP